MTRRAVITGIGVIAPNGIGSSAWWKATRIGRTGIRRISRFDPSEYPVQLAGEIEGFEPTEFLDQRLVVQTDLWAQLALAATDMAWKDASLEPESLEPFSAGVITAASMGGTGAAQREMQNLWGKGPIFVGAYQTIAAFHAAVSGQISIRGRLKGPAGVICTEGAGGLDALGQACRSIRHGQDVVVSGGVESPLSPYALTCQIAGGELSGQRDIRAAYRPFDVRANGYVPGEGGAIVLVEEIEHARRRSSSTIYGEIAGYAATNDGFHHTRPDPSGRQLARAISLALQRASLSPDEVDVVFADASGVPERDVIEARVIRETFGDRSRELPVTAPKTMTGRLSSGGGALDVAAALFSMREGCIPPTINLNHPAGGCNLHFVLNEAFEAKVNAALVIARGFGGFNSAMILRRLPEDAG